VGLHGPDHQGVGYPAGYSSLVAAQFDAALFRRGSIFLKISRDRNTGVLRSGKEKRDTFFGGISCRSSVRKLILEMFRRRAFKIKSATKKKMDILA